MLKKKDESINIDIKLIMGGGKPPMGHHGDMDGDKKHGMLPGTCESDMGEPDWKSIAKQLLQSVSLMDTETDAVESAGMDPQAAIDAIDQMTSRILWGKQDDSNPMSSYQNANYGATTSNGLVMQNPAVTYNNAAYGDLDPDTDGDVDFHKLDVGKLADMFQEKSKDANNPSDEEDKKTDNKNPFGKDEPDDD